MVVIYAIKALNYQPDGIAGKSWFSHRCQLPRSTIRGRSGGNRLSASEERPNQTEAGTHRLFLVMWLKVLSVLCR